jgi:hypothetical protein
MPASLLLQAAITVRAAGISLQPQIPQQASTWESSPCFAFTFKAPTRCAQ